MQKKLAMEAMVSAAASTPNELMNFTVSGGYLPPPPPPPPKHELGGGESNDGDGGGGRSKKRRRKARVCKNKEEAETQRMTHIAVERNRRKLMNEHLALLRSLMPPSYVQRGDQASIVAGAVEFVKELEHLLHSLQAQKLQLLSSSPNTNYCQEEESTKSQTTPPFADFFFNQTRNSNNNTNTKTILTCSSTSTSTSSSSSSDEQDSSINYTSDGVAGVEVTLIETHANMRILLTRKTGLPQRRRPWQLSKLVAGFHALRLTVLHFTITTLHPFSLYSISAQVEEGCQLTSVDDIAAAVHRMLRLIIEDEEDHFSFSSSSSSPLLLPLS